MREIRSPGSVRGAVRKGRPYRDRGALLGRPRSLAPEQVEMARTMLANPKLSARQVAQQLGVHRATLYRYLTQQPRR